MTQEDFPQPWRGYWKGRSRSEGTQAWDKSLTTSPIDSVQSDLTRIFNFTFSCLSGHLPAMTPTPASPHPLPSNSSLKPLRRNCSTHPLTEMGKGRQKAWADTQSTDFASGRDYWPRGKYLSGSALLLDAFAGLIFICNIESAHREHGSQMTKLYLSTLQSWPKTPWMLKSHL